MNTVTAGIYQPQSVLTLLSRAWNLLRLNLKKVLWVLLPLTLLNTALHFLISLLSSSAFLTQSTLPELQTRLLLLLGSFLLVIPTTMVYMISFSLLCRFFYLALLQEQPPSLRECLLHLQKNWLPLTGLILLLGFLFLSLIVVNVIVFYAGFIFVAVTVGALVGSSLAVGNLGVKFMIGVSILMTGALALGILTCLISLQWFLLNFPIAAMATAPSEKPNLWKTVSGSITLIFRNFPRLVGFSVCGLLLSLSILSVLLSPVVLWMGLEQSRLGLHQTIPLYLQTVWNVWNSLVNCLMMPYYVSALILMWYDCQARSEGLDIQLWIEQRQPGAHRLKPNA
ncbi:hypothetical protein [Vampirovibrio chlorellavorus]|uniref:hypothetical protein n=1 Tax=Vampirovibrio chlorellavorus TaxID=758823 RepID=UPI0026EAF429|nr:hypothetical protein [Vampirovibrio chlorellavorus]